MPHVRNFHYRSIKCPMCQKKIKIKDEKWFCSKKSEEEKHLIKKFDNVRKRIDKWGDFSKVPIVTKANLDLAKELKMRFYKKKKISEILKMIDNHVMDSSASIHIFEIHRYPIFTPINHLIAVIHGGLYDRLNFNHFDDHNAIKKENKNQIMINKRFHDKYLKKTDEIYSTFLSGLYTKKS